MFGRPLGGAILVGIGEDTTDDRRTMTLAITEESPGRPFYVLHAGKMKSHPCALEIEDRIGAWMDAAANRLAATAPRPF